MVEVYKDFTSNQFLTVYIAIVNHQEIPVGGIKAVGTFEPGGLKAESPLSKWFFDARTAPGAVVKTGSVKFEPGGIQAGAWFIHLENEQGVRLSEDVTINTDPNSPEWFYIKFKESVPGGVAVAPTPNITIPAIGVTSTPAQATAGWSFVNMQMINDTGSRGVIIYGDMVNNTGSSQELAYVTGTFYDNQGRSFAGTNYTYDYWPIQVVPPGSKVPFELSVFNVPNVTNYTLSVISQPTSETPRQNFEFFDLGNYIDAGYYCVTGKARNSGGVLADYLVVVAVLFNAQNQVINFDSYEEPDPDQVSGGQAADFEICIDPYEQSVARYEVRAWGQ